MTLFKSKLLHKTPAADPPPSSPVDAHKWKQKEILRLKQDLKEAEGRSLSSSSSLSARVGDRDPLLKIAVLNAIEGEQEKKRCWLSRATSFFRNCLCLVVTVLYLIFLSVEEYNGEDEMEQLRASVDFLVELCDTVSSPRVDGSNFANWSHQAVDFILAALKSRWSIRTNNEPVEGIVSSLIMRLVRRMCTTIHRDDPHQGLSRPVTDQRQEKPVEGEHSGQSSSPDPVPGLAQNCPTRTTSSGLPNGLDDFDSDVQLYVQHLIRKLGSEPFIGQRVILSVSQRIAELAENFLFMDPFNEAFPDMHNCMHMMIQLIEFLASDYLVAWSSAEGFDTRLFEEWVTSLPHARKALELLESRNGLYVLYMDRVIGEVTKLVGPVSSLHKLNPVIFDSLVQ
ncbi:hypothetical protein RJ639_020286 [Escallonia herrerae]|uniref:Uncharacterized protein n=2 Tax=Escallonia herrerae TaxID=1293975 RepID=A0AA89AFM4_9ASTE|nr:hypothetical protein RJ639_020286 [Escallonia herrerae]